MLKFFLMLSMFFLITACTQQTTSNNAAKLKNDDEEQSNRADSTLTVYQEGDKTIEERRIKGFIYSVKVIPKQGSPYYLINADGDNNTLQNSPPKQKIPSWTLFSW